MTRDFQKPDLQTDSPEDTRTASPFMLFFCLTWFAFCAVAFSDAGSNVLLVVLSFYVASAWSLMWLIRLAISLRRRSSGDHTLKRPWQYWLFEPATIAVAMALSYLDTFSWLRFAVSEPALTSYVEGVRAGKVDLGFEFEHPPRRIGLYTVTFTDSLDDGTVRLITSSHGLLDKAGVANSPNTPPPKRGEDSYKHIHHDWWFWYQSW